MSFVRQGDVLACDDVPLTELAARYGTPLYVYSATAMLARLAAYRAAFATDVGGRHLVAYSVKACSNLAVVRTLVAAGAGCDIVSGGELERARAAGCSPDRVVFSGVGKQSDELAAALSWGEARAASPGEGHSGSPRSPIAAIKCINVESAAELDQVDAVARRLGVRAPIALRVNPDVDAHTHPYIATGLATSKFGVPLADARALYARARSLTGIAIRGVACHIGSQLTDLAPLADALARIVPLVSELTAAGDPLDHLDVGGGLGIHYGDTSGALPEPADYVRTVRAALAPLAALGLELVCEPGRSIVGAAGVLVTRVILEKGSAARRFLVVDAAMTELIRPALYEAVHEIVPVTRPATAMPTRAVDVVGPVCESGDILGLARELPESPPGTLYAILGAGAYGMAMASTYNTRPRVAEVLVRGREVALIRHRETVADLLRGEVMPPWLDDEGAR